MEFRVWLVLANEKDARTFMSEIVTQYAVSPMGSDNNDPLYNQGDGVVTVMFRVTTHATSQEDFNTQYNEALARISNDVPEEGDVELVDRDDSSTDAADLDEALQNILQRLGLRWHALVVNSREGQCSYAVPKRAKKTRFSVIDDHA